jgi:hypothetical protein
MSLTKLSLSGKILISRQGESLLVTSRLGTGKSLTFFYSVDAIRQEHVIFFTINLYTFFVAKCFQKETDPILSVSGYFEPAIIKRLQEGEFSIFKGTESRDTIQIFRQ